MCNLSVLVATALQTVGKLRPRRERRRDRTPLPFSVRPRLWNDAAMTPANDDRLSISLLTREYPPSIYGGAGVHVAQLVPQLRKLIRQPSRSSLVTSVN